MYAPDITVQAGVSNFSSAISQDTRAHYVNENGTELKVRVPTNARNNKNDPITVGYRLALADPRTTRVTSSDNLSIIFPRSVLSDFIPLSAAAGDELTINGENFAAFAEYNQARFHDGSDITKGTKNAHGVNEDRTQLKVNVPDLGDQVSVLSIQITIGTVVSISQTGFTYDP